MKDQGFPRLQGITHECRENPKRNSRACTLNATMRTIWKTAKETIWQTAKLVSNADEEGLWDVNCLRPRARFTGSHVTFVLPQNRCSTEAKDHRTAAHYVHEIIAVVRGRVVCVFYIHRGHEALRRYRLRALVLPRTVVLRCRLRESCLHTPPQGQM